MQYAVAEALKGGVPGLVAMAIQVLALMWLRTTMNYQYRYGTSTREALRTLYAQGGIRRFYQGLLPALIQGPLSRFGDTAANAGVMAFFAAAASADSGMLLVAARLPLALKSLVASLTAALFRIVLTPVDTLKTAMQVEGDRALPMLASKIAKGGPGVLFHGALATSAATFAGHYPWFLVYNTLDSTIPKPSKDALALKLLRSAVLGFFGSLAADLASNALRVVKTAKQTSETPISYSDATKAILEREGLQGLFVRGLGTKILCNGIQGTLFSVLWRLGQERLAAGQK
uniref:Mitochondrial carrier protein n=1 Tax=Polytomella parva TaxID=51329 RepID=A0A7S0USL9_9CHLO